MDRSETFIRDILSLAGVEINGPNPWDIRVHDRRFYGRVLKDESLGLGESYVDGWWDCESLDGLFHRILLARLQDRVKGDWKFLLQALIAKFINLQSISRSFEVIKKHYDLVGNDIFEATLDKRMNYTCGYWKDAKNVDEAQEAKLELVCRKLGLKPGMKVLEFGCGWGSFAKYAAERYGVSVVGVTISRRQVETLERVCRGLPVDIRFQDYRAVEGKFDRVLSIGMMEHIGEKNYRTYFKKTDQCLKDGGIALVHTIGSNYSSQGIQDAWLNKYIFPNAMAPSISQLGKAMENLLVMEDWHNFGMDYDKTLMAWYGNFEKAWPGLKNKYGERFYRMWKYYLLSCAGGFRSRNVQLWQVVLTKPGALHPERIIL